MIPRPTLSATLSLPIVAIAAVILPRSDRAPEPRSGAHAPPDRPESSPQPTPKPKPTPTPTVAWADAEPERPAPAQAPPPPAPPVPRPVPFATRKPKSFLTRALPGERLADVAARVYGTAADPLALWDVNRDQVASIDAPLRPGMVLRTPALR